MFISMMLMDLPWLLGQVTGYGAVILLSMIVKAAWLVQTTVQPSLVNHNSS